MASKLSTMLAELKPSVASVISTVTIGGNAAVWMDAIKGWAAVVTVLVGVPTAVCIMAYWALQVRKAWRNRDL